MKVRYVNFVASSIKSSNKSSGGTYKVGDIVNFKGGTHYVSSYAGARGYTARAGKAKITSISKGSAHPYHLVKVAGGGSTVYGWVNADTFTSSTGTTTTGGYNISSSVTDITDYVSSIGWSGSTDEVARKLTLTIVNAPTDPHIKNITLKLGGMVYLYDDDGKELFRGYVVDRERGSNNTLTYTVYDLLYYTLKSKATYNFKKKSPEDITKAVCKDLQIPVGNIVKTGKKYNLLLKDKTIYEIIMASYTKANSSTGNKYHITTSKGKLNVSKMGDDWVSLLLSDSSNVTSSTTKESIADMVNQVKVYDDKGKLLKVVKNDDNIVKYGIFQQTYTKEKDKDPTNSAKAMLKGVTRTIELECIGDTGCVTGKCVKVIDSTTGNTGKFYITSDNHSWVDGVYTMSLSLSLTNAMDKVSSD